MAYINRAMEQCQACQEGDHQHCPATNACSPDNTCHCPCWEEAD